MRRKYDPFFLKADAKGQFEEDLNDLFSVGLVTSLDWTFEAAEERSDDARGDIEVNKP